LGDEEEPTPGASCLEDLDMVSAEDIVELEATLYTRPGTLYDVLVEGGRYEVYLRVYSAFFDCLRVVELRVRACGEGSLELFKLVEWPEVSRAIVEGSCVELVVPAEPLFRVVSMLRKLGFSEVRLSAFREARLES